MKTGGCKEGSWSLNVHMYACMDDTLVRKDSKGTFVEAISSFAEGIER